ncbi:MAG: tetratricopeptide repeat protein [Oscillospiraceae bacterium]|nr:tetratricopeptide repeat protein [Oscillospiraceae bacterium]
MSNNYAIFEKAFMLYSDGKTDAAMKKLTPAVEDGFADAEELLGTIYVEKGQYTEAEKWYKCAHRNSRSQPYHAAALVKRGAANRLTIYDQLNTAVMEREQ